LKKQIKEAKEAKKKDKLALLNPLVNSIETHNIQEFDGTVKMTVSKIKTVEQDEDEELFTVKEVHHWGKDQKEPVDEIPPLLMSTKKISKKMKLDLDGELKGKNRKSSKLLFDEEGNSISKKIELSNASQMDLSSNEIRIAEHTIKTKQRIDQGRKEVILSKLLTINL
jgi:hypothetical protein